MSDIPVIIETSHETDILTVGKAPLGNMRRAFAFGVGALALILVAMISFILLLAQPISIPQPAFLMITTPRGANRAAPELVSSLPTPWKTALRDDSSLPVILGASHAQSGWQFFALVPRTRNITNIRAKHGAFALIGDGEVRTPWKYTTSWSWDGLFGSDARAWIDPSALGVDASPFTASMNRGTWKSSVTLNEIPNALPLMDADISINAPDQEADIIQRAVLKNAHLNQSVSQRWPLFDQWNLRLTSSTPDMFLRKQTPLSADELRHVQTSVGQIKKVRGTLPDGSLFWSLRPLEEATSTPSLYHGQEITVLEDRVWLRSSSSLPMIEIKTCADEHSTPWARISARGMERLLSIWWKTDVHTNISLTFFLKQHRIFGCTE